MGGNVSAEVKTHGPARIVFVSKGAASSDDSVDDTYAVARRVLTARAGSDYSEVSTTCPNWIVIDASPDANEEGLAEVVAGGMGDGEVVYVG